MKHSWRGCSTIPASWSWPPTFPSNIIRSMHNHPRAWIGLRPRFSIDTALGGEPALALIASQGRYAVIVTDMQMPGMDGVEFLMQARQKAPDTVRLMLTGNADQKTAVEAMNKGHVFQFLNKPCPPEMLA